MPALLFRAPFRAPFFRHYDCRLKFRKSQIRIEYKHLPLEFGVCLCKADDKL